MKEQNKTQELAFFNRFTQSKDYDSLTVYGYNSIIKSFRRCLGPKFAQIKTATDFGCGTGSFTRRFFNTAGINVLGVDISFNAILRAKSKNDGIQYLVCDITQAAIKNESMDLIIFSGVLHHFPDMAACLQEAHRILKKGGAVLSYDPHSHNPAMWLYRAPRSPFYSKIGKTDNERLLSKKDIQEAFQQAGFINITTETISGVTISYLESKIARIFLPLYNAQEYLLGLLPLSRSIGSFVICHAQK